MTDTCPICLGSSVHKLRAYPQEFDLPSLSDHRSMDDKPSCGSDAPPRKHAAAPRSELQTGDLDQKRWSLARHVDIGCEKYTTRRTFHPCSGCALE
jgi:hypothetical protein